MQQVQNTARTNQAASQRRHLKKQSLVTTAINAAALIAPYLRGWSGLRVMPAYPEPYGVLFYFFIAKEW